jgi:hypothetical protein
MHPILIHELARQRVAQIEHDRRVRRRRFRGGRQEPRERY